MAAIIDAAIFTLIIYCITYLFKKQLNIYAVASLFILFYVVALIFGPTLHAGPPDSKTEIRHMQSYLSFVKKKSKNKEPAISPLNPKPKSTNTVEQHQANDNKFYEDKYKFHKSNGERCYNDAKNRCAFLPTFNDRENARFCLITAGTLIVPTDPMSKLITVTIELFIYYGLSVMDEWEYIENKLNWAKYHFEMMEFYQDVLQQHF